MLCQHCQKRVANVHFTQIINSKKVEMFLCDQCAKEKGQINMGMPLSIDDFFTGLIGLGHENSYVNSQPQRKIVCEKCGMSLEEFQKTGKLGCNNCYDIYSDRLRPLLKRLHGNTEHNGKTPISTSKKTNATDKIEKLKELLNKAIQKEDYEKAAEIRDKIKSLEKGASI